MTVFEKLQRFRESEVDENLPKTNMRLVVNHFPGGWDKPKTRNRVLAYDLNELIKNLEPLNKYEDIDFLLDCFYEQRLDELVVCLNLSFQNRLDAITKVIGLIKSNRMNEFYWFREMLFTQGFDVAIRNLNLIYHRATTVNDMMIDNARLNSILSYTGNAGLSIDQQQAVNKKFADTVVEVHKADQMALNKAKVDLVTKRSDHDEEIRFSLERAETFTSTGVNPFSQGNETEINFSVLENKFIFNHHLVRVQFGDDLEIFKWDSNTGRYITVSSMRMLTDLAMSYLYKTCGVKANFSTSDVEKMVNRVKYVSSPVLGAVDVPALSNERQVFFTNGYYDLKERCFHSLDTAQYFHIFAMPFPYQDTDNEPRIFELILRQMFDGDELKLKLVYQIIGALISHVTLKYLFVFQGVTHGGKSTLMECIRRLFNPDETKAVGSMREISDGKGFRTEKKVRLLCIDDAPNEKWNDNVVSYLKTRSRGTAEKGLPVFKILMNTNYPIIMKTADGRDESIDTRIIVLPFVKNMKDSADYDAHFIKDYLENKYDEERPAIVKKALEEFIEVMRNNETFAAQFSLNECVSVANNTPISSVSVEKDSLLLRIVNENFEFVDREQFQDNPKIGMLAKHVYKYVNGEQSNLISRPAELSKQLKNLFPEQFFSKEYADKTYFNLKLKD